MTCLSYAALSALALDHRTNTAITTSAHASIHFVALPKLMFPQRLGGV
jgi:hypothetical protein